MPDCPPPAVPPDQCEVIAVYPPGDYDLRTRPDRMTELICRSVDRRPGGASTEPGRPAAAGRDKQCSSAYWERLEKFT